MKRLRFMRPSRFVPNLTAVIILITAWRQSPKTGRGFCTAFIPTAWRRCMHRASNRFLISRRISNSLKNRPLALDCLASGEIWVSEDLADALRALGPPAYYMDFETMAPGIPAYVGTRPYETVPFQFSVHYIDEDGVLAHTAFLAEGDVHPGREFAEELIAAIDQYGSSSRGL